MTQKEMLALVRKLISDEQATGFTEGGNLEEPEGTQELLNYLDRAVDEYSKRQAANADTRLVRSMTISSSNMYLPDGFLMFCGLIPAQVEGNFLFYYGDMVNPTVKYFERLPYVSSYPETAPLPYEQDQYMTIAALAAIYALNKHEFNVSQDLLLLGMGGQDANAQQ